MIRDPSLGPPNSSIDPLGRPLGRPLGSSQPNWHSEPSRRLFLKIVGAVPAAALLAQGCGTEGPRYLTDTERRVLGACADAIFPPDDRGPGAAELGAVDFIDNLLTAFEHDPPRL
ncbi:MAG TPA: hypothetical protein VHN14_28050, partial [Kofleriaceae bacterium]|nr:hypothetical protein [Kofleriaceae bacterium]